MRELGIGDFIDVGIFIHKLACNVHVIEKEVTNAITAISQL
jgi:hypothetical protein